MKTICKARQGVKYMKTTILIIAFIVGVLMGASLMSLVAAQRARELERNVAYFKAVYATAQNELKRQSIINNNNSKENVTFKLEEYEE